MYHTAYHIYQSSLQTKHSAIFLALEIVDKNCSVQLKHCKSYTGKINKPEILASCGMENIKAWPVTKPFPLGWLHVPEQVRRHGVLLEVQLVAGTRDYLRMALRRDGFGRGKVVLGMVMLSLRQSRGLSDQAVTEMFLLGLPPALAKVPVPPSTPLPLYWPPQACTWPLTAASTWDLPHILHLGAQLMVLSPSESQG